MPECRGGLVCPARRRSFATKAGGLGSGRVGWAARLVQSTRTAVMLEATLAHKMGLVAVIAAAAVGTTWIVLPEAFPSFRQQRSGLEQLAARPQPAAAPAASRTAVRVEAPRLDVARVGARGMLVTAGRAPAGAEVTLLEGQRELGRARADNRGEWVILPNDALAPGARELSLLSRLA